ncbi:Dipeptidase E [Chitinophaga sp. 180180018-2]|uniref:Type 1 glutamine amidotransferase-like domain-containing protein n=2 Tax=unclassified Chitinophaga TaxID=2619133 RepID=UPI002DE64E3A|nr:Dipeptidase E [Chitinophaga sp. 212800010-3]
MPDPDSNFYFKANIMKLLLTSGGISNASIYNALVDLLGKPIDESNALFIPTAIYPHLHGGRMALQAICGKGQSQLCQLGWKSLGVLELTALPSIAKEIWLPSLEEADVLLVWGGDVLYLSYWIQQSGLADLLPSLLHKMVYVGVSAGSMAASSLFGETYRNPRGGSGNTLTSENIVFPSPQGEISRTFITARGTGLVDFALIPHFCNPEFPDASETNAGKWAGMLSVPVYAIDDQSAIKVVGDSVEVVSEGYWKLFSPGD